MMVVQCSGGAESNTILFRGNGQSGGHSDRWYDRTNPDPPCPSAEVTAWILGSALRFASLRPRMTKDERFSALPIAELGAGPVFLALDILHHGLAAAHALGLLVVGIARRAEQMPALVQRRRHLVAEAGIVRAGQKAVEFHFSFLW
ncbi:hypothetical protein MES5069_540021 [Mesorhizobium escarrei]|uniref:Uncharacterized protein n=1 Tax=Mesorhizobium escarrei TaxID=666018 RepID=A0ABM9EC12_9HYPH|nr:hypothetical protein MES5069_540021 [Mesorhizobium escarrei]